MAQIIRIIDNSNVSNLTRGLEIVASAGNTTYGVNTGVRATGHTFGVQALTTGLAGGTSTPAAIYGEITGTTQGDALRLYSSNITAATQNMAQFYQEGTAFIGTGLLMNFGAGVGSFTGNFLDLQVNTATRFKISNMGTTTIGDGTNSAGLRIIKGSICVDDDGSCIGTTTGAVAAVSFLTGKTDDLAETYYSTEALERGDIVYTAGKYSVGKASTSSQPIIGVVSTRPGFLLAAGEEGISSPAPGTAYPIGLSGRIPIKVSNENGAINTGDPIVLSDISGIGMKDNDRGGTVVGIALEAFDGIFYLSEAARENEAVKTPIGEPVCTPKNNASDAKISGGQDVEGSSIPIESSSGSGNGNTEDCIQPMEYVKPDAGTAKDETTSSGATVKVGKILLFINLGQPRLTVNENTTIAEALPTNAWGIDQNGGKVNVNFFGDINLQGNKLLDVSRVSGFGGKFLIDEEGNLVAKSVQAEKGTFTNELNVGTSDVPTGINLFDTVTKQPYCVQLANGTLGSTPGRCPTSSALPTPSSPVPPSPTTTTPPPATSDTTATTDSSTVASSTEPVSSTSSTSSASTTTDSTTTTENTTPVDTTTTETTTAETTSVSPEPTPADTTPVFSEISTP